MDDDFFSARISSRADSRKYFLLGFFASRYRSHAHDDAFGIALSKLQSSFEAESGVLIAKVNFRWSNVIDDEGLTAPVTRIVLSRKSALGSFGG